MRRMLGLAMAAGLGAAGLAVPAYAAPLGQGATIEADANLIQVRDGCGIGWHRDFYGGCVPNRQQFVDTPSYEPFYPPPAIVVPEPPRVYYPPPVYREPSRFVVQPRFTYYN